MRFESNRPKITRRRAYCSGGDSLFRPFCCRFRFFQYICYCTNTLNFKFMKKIFMFSLAGALALAATACDDKDDKGGGIPVR